MCDPSRFKLCSCEAVDSHDLPADVLVWALRRRVGTRQEMIMGKLVGPTSKLDGKWQSDWVEDALNSENRFDFPYEPQSHDWLTIRYGGGAWSHFMSFVYRGGRWQRDQRLGFMDLMEDLGKGKVECK